MGAGAGSYEPDDRRVVAVEPSARMIAQRPAGAAPAVRAVAEALPFRAGAFDAALAVLTLHHWTDRAAGLRELARVARRVVILTWERGAAPAPFWLTAEYFPEIDAMDAGRFPLRAELTAGLDVERVEPVPIARDCADGFLGAYWARPEAYLDPAVRQPISGFSQLEPAVVERGVARLAADLRSGAWDRRFGALRRADTVDLGYRLIIANGNLTG